MTTSNHTPSGENGEKGEKEENTILYTGTTNFLKNIDWLHARF
jgi:hypothetical protein